MKSHPISWSLLAASLYLSFHTLAWSAPGAHGPDGEHLAAPGAVAAGGLARLPDGSVNVPMLAQRRMGIRTQFATTSQVQASVELAGRVVMDPNAGGRVQTVHGGRIEAGPSGLPVVGQRVQKGQVLAYVGHRADPLSQANQQALLAELRSNRQLAAQRVQRLQSLEGTVPRKDIEAARAELESLTQREHSIAASLGVREALTAPVSGVIARANVAVGQVTDARELLFEIIDPARLLVEASTADPALAARIASATLREAPQARLQKLGAGAALRDGMLPIHFRVQTAPTAQAAQAAQALPLAVGQPVTLMARLAETIEGFVLPAQAVVRNPANEPVVWIKAGAQRYIPQPVRFRALDATTVVVLQGLGAENRVVTDGAALLAQIR